MFRTVSPETLAAIHAQDEPVPFMELIDSGLLWWINTGAFHKMGRKLEITPEGFRLLGDGEQDWIGYDNANGRERSFSAIRTLDPLPTLKKLDWFYKFLE